MSMLHDVSVIDSDLLTSQIAVLKVSTKMLSHLASYCIFLLTKEIGKHTFRNSLMFSTNHNLILEDLKTFFATLL